MADWDFEELYPGRFIKGDMFKGKAATLTITDIDREEITDPKGKKSMKVILYFKERDRHLITNKLNCIALMLMFGKNTKDWRGKRVTFYGEKGTWFGKKGEAVRIYGSPDIAKDIQQSVKLGLEMEEYHLKKVVLGKKVAVPAPAPPPELELEMEDDADPLTGEVPFSDDEQAEIRAKENANGLGLEGA